MRWRVRHELKLARVDAVLDGVESGFKHVEAEDRSATLLRLKGRGNRVSSCQVPLKRAAMNSGDISLA